MVTKSLYKLTLLLSGLGMELAEVDVGRLVEGRVHVEEVCHIRQVQLVVACYDVLGRHKGPALDLVRLLKHAFCSLVQVLLLV